MVELEHIREYIKKKLGDEGERQSITFKRASIEQALAEASIELNTPVEKIDYEVLEQGSNGFFGIGKKDWTILAYISGVDARLKMGARQILKDSGIIQGNVVNIDGEIFVHVEKAGLMLKVTPPKQGGMPASFESAMTMLTNRIPDEIIDEKLVRKVVENATGEFIKILSIKHIPSEDALVTFSISEDEMEAFITISPPGKGGADPTAQYIKKYIKMNGIQNGLLDKQILAVEESPTFGVPILIAKGAKPKNGENQRIEYKFDTENKIKIKEVKGKVNFKELNRINNVIEGSVVADILKPTKGEPGYTVTGKYLDATDGEESEINLGNNVKKSEDGISIVATISGQVNIINGRVNVDPVYVVEKDVDLTTGNITFLGNIIIKGSIQDGFSVKSSSTVEVYGHVGKCSIDAQGDITVHQGISGRDDMIIKGNGDLFSKFIENANIDVAGNVFVTDGIMNSKISCGKKVICKGKKATIVGGEITACEEIIAKNIGSPAGTETTIKAGTDPKAKARIEELRGAALELHNEQVDINHNYLHLLTIFKENKGMAPDKVNQMKEFKKRKKAIEKELVEIDIEINELIQKTKDIALLGKISATSIVYPGVFLTIKDVDFQVKNDFNATTFFLKDNYIDMRPFADKEYDDVDFSKQFEKK